MKIEMESMTTGGTFTTKVTAFSKYRLRIRDPGYYLNSEADEFREDHDLLAEMTKMLTKKELKLIRHVWPNEMKEPGFVIGKRPGTEENGIYKVSSGPWDKVFVKGNWLIPRNKLSLAIEGAMS